MLKRANAWLRHDVAEKFAEQLFTARQQKYFGFSTSNRTSPSKAKRHSAIQLTLPHLHTSVRRVRELCALTRPGATVTRT